MSDFLPIGMSVVVPTYNSSKYLARLLDTLGQAEQGFGLVEVIVVDDSFPAEAQTIRYLCETHNARYVECRGNVSVKRNYGVKQASHELILFIDSDCEATPALLKEHARLAESPTEVGAMLGVVEFVGSDTFMWRVVERSQFLGPYTFAQRLEYAPWGGAGNLSVRKRVFQSIGGFNEDFLKSPGGEDVDLGLRLNDAGYRIKCNPNCLAYHTRETWQGFWRMARRVFGYGRAHYHILVNHAAKTGYEYPRLAGAMLLIMVTLGLCAVINQSGWPLVAELAYCFTVLLFQAGLVLRQSNRPLHLIGIELTAHLLDLIFEIGIIFESLMHGDLRGFHRKMIYNKYQLYGERDRKIIQAWSLVLGFAPLVLLIR